ncbi:DUF2927 domain-containing protein [Jannaschia rubra]|uniref:DUF2927 domain-containing protein n=1 Tax=Jannaschia rubra TaxID=282197 RepID=A0A0M6XQL8_9RHOB|nr:DUF2927 domain-containing protein [Jannaschia rubra]CTQ32334.1 hypothetical protein JAN5088_01099 [Jannaschia rubra]SFG46858.1 Protein of unknown function [Jannaschia rubra]
MSRLRALGILTVMALAACDPVDPPLQTSPRPLAAPVRPERAVLAQGPSEESRALRRYYSRLEQSLKSDGLLRTDSGEADAPFTAAELARNFERIALFSEYTQVGGRYVAQESRAQLRRWERPVRVELHFGASVPEATRRTDTARIQAYVARLSSVTGHPISVVNQAGNYHIFVASVDEQRGLGPQISAVEPGLSRSTVREITSLDRSTYCAVYASSSSDRPNAYVSAIAFVRSEHPDLFRLSCYHEEIAQGLGLANDSPDVRPSIFNDDEEFALLTRHDELLLRILYDRRLRVGISDEEARPIIRQIAAELVGTGPA